MCQLVNNWLGEILGISQQAVQVAEQCEEIPKRYVDRLLKALPGKRAVIEAHASSNTPSHQTNATNLVIADDDPVLDSSSIEEEARGWVEEFRTSVLLERLSRNARDHGLIPQRVPLYRWARYLGPPESTTTRRRRRTPRLGILFSPVRSFGLPPATFIGIGSPFKRPIVSDVLTAFSKELGTDLRFHPGSGADRAHGHVFFFGYDTAINTLFIGEKPYHSLRYIALDDRVVYQDYGLVVYGPRGSVTEVLGDSLPHDARQVAFICGAHRLSSGTATRLLEDGDLQVRVLGDRLTFNRYGGFAFRITRASGNLDPEEQLEIIWRRVRIASVVDGRTSLAHHVR